MFGFTRRLVPSLVFVSAALTAGCTCGSGPYTGDYLDDDRPPPADYKYAQSPKSDPKLAGCADGQREGFADLKQHPRIAGCVGAWKGDKSLRDKPTGTPCGDDGAKCNVPADVCAPGWHVCGVDGKASDLSSHTTAKDCDNAGPGRFNAALSHSPTDEIDPCPTIKPNQILPCVGSGLGSEPVCCGADCLSGKCTDGVWKGKTEISRGTSEGCGAVSSSHNSGVLCCFDGPGVPTVDVAVDAATAGTPVEATAGADGGSGAAEGDAKGDAAKGDAAKGDAAKGDVAKGDAKAAKPEPGDADAQADEKAKR